MEQAGQRRDYHERYLPDDSIGAPDECEPIAMGEEPEYWDKMPEAALGRTRERNERLDSLLRALADPGLDLRPSRLRKPGRQASAPKRLHAM